MQHRNMQKTNKIVVLMNITRDTTVMVIKTATQIK